MPVCRPWEPWENALAVECGGGADFARVAKITGRTKAAVRRQRYELKPVGWQTRRWSESELAVLRALPDTQLPRDTLVKLAHALGRSYTSVKSKRQRLLLAEKG